MKNNSKKISRFKISGILLLLIGLVLIYFKINPSKVDFLPKCPLYLSSGLYCPGCGSQRAVHHLLHFDIFKAIQQNLLFFIGLLLLFYYLFVEIINFMLQKNIPNYLNKSKAPLVLLLLIIAFGILRNIPTYPFNLLAPK